MPVTFRRRDNLKGTEAEEKIGQAVREGFEPLGDELVKTLQAQLPISNGGKFARGVDRGRFRRGMKKSVSGRGLKTRMRVFNNDPKAEYLEQDRKPGKGPSSDALLPWVRRKGLGAQSFSVATRRAIVAGTRRIFNRKAGKLRTRVQSLLQIQKSIAFLIARKIGKEGLPGFFLFKNLKSSQAAKISRAITDIKIRVTNILNS